MQLLLFLAGYYLAHKYIFLTKIRVTKKHTTNFWNIYTVNKYIYVQYAAFKSAYILHFHYTSNIFRFYRNIGIPYYFIKINNNSTLH